MMKISEIIFEMRPGYRPGYIELRCSIEVDGEVFPWKEVVEDDDFESRFSIYFKLMKARLLDAIRGKSRVDK